MANHFRLYSRPLMADEVEVAMTVTGELENYNSGEAYESRLTINDSRGRCTVEVLPESVLPAGAFVRVDNVTKEVVVKWAAHEEVEGDREVPNGGFEAGNDGTWTKGGRNGGEGWSIGSAGYDTHAGTYSAQFAGIITTASDFLCTVVPAEPGDSIRLEGQVQQGASAKNSAGARVALIFRDSDGGELLRRDGNLVAAGAGGRWYPSVAEGIAPNGTSGVQACITGFRRRENKPLWVDSLRWNHRYVLGQNNTETYFLSIKVKDAANQVAYWSGSIEEGPAEGTLIEYMPTAFSQSSNIASRIATTANMADAITTMSGVNTGNSFPGGEWVQADLGAAHEVSQIMFGTGTLQGVGDPVADLGGWFGQFFQIECSTDGVTWEVLTHTYRVQTIVESPAAEHVICFRPKSARYWRLHNSSIQAVRTRTFRLYGYLGGLTLASPTYTQSSTYSGLSATAASVNEVPVVLTTGAATNNSANEWIQADLGSVRDVRLLIVSGGNLPGWGGVSSYLSGSSVTAEISVDGVVWTPKGMLSYFISDTSPISEVGIDITGAARYVRIKRAAYLATAAMRVYHV
jgi:hypothetical protein